MLADASSRGKGAEFLCISLIVIKCSNNLFTYSWYLEEVRQRKKKEKNETLQDCYELMGLRN
jgi:hypothetical protein